MVRRARGVLIGLAIAIAGCGSSSSGDGGGGGDIPTTVPGNKRISDLTPAEREQLCDDVGAWAMSGAFLTDGCNASAWLTTSLFASSDPSATDAALRDMCQTFYTLCVANGVTTNCGRLPTTCTATVGQYNACLSDSVDALGVLPPCSSATRASLANTIAVLAAQPSSAVCMTLEAKCPGSTM